MMNYPLAYIPNLLPVPAALLALGLGLFVFFRNVRHPANIGFGLGMLCYVLIESGNAVFLLSNSGNLAVLGKKISLVGEALLPSAWFLFSLTFARVNYKEVLFRWLPVTAGLFITSLVFIMWQNSSLFFSLPTLEITHEVLLLGPVGRYFYVFKILGMVINIIHLENTLRFSYGSKRHQVKYVIIGVGSLLSFQIYLASRAILFSVLDVNYIPAGSVVTAISSGLMLIAIIKQKLLNVNIYVSRYVIYNSLTVFLVGAYLLLVGLITQGIKFIGGEYDTFWSPLFIFIALTGVFVVLFSSRVKRKLQLIVNKHFYRHKYEFKDKWMETVEKLGIKSDLSDIRTSIVEMISETMGPRGVFLWLHDSSSIYNMAASTVNISDRIQIAEKHPLILYIKGHRSPFFLTEIEAEDESAFRKNITPLIAITRGVLCTPLIVEGKDLIGFIIQEADISGEPYTSDDIDLLKAISAHAANRIKNISLTEEIVAAKEAETFHQVSTFFIHDLKNLVSTLSLLVQNSEDHLSNPLFQQDAMKTLKSTVSKMNSMISNLTLLSKGIHVHLSPVNLNSLLDEIVSSLNGQETSSLRIIKKLGNVPSVRADGEQLKKVLLNLILNAIEASPPDSKIKVDTLSKNGDVILSVADNGCGMSRDFMQSSLFRPFRTTKSNGLGIGLFHCKKIIDAHEGKIEVESEEGKGSVFRVILPVEGNLK
ncbi:MAG: PEP-CTERM system histidine kinase PrsK [Nitrospirae bacterium]|nr:PEP-CTERM system histidine kinase PrsK [Nitrospirota bacterium]